MTKIQDITVTFQTATAAIEIQQAIARPDLWWMQDYKGKSHNSGDHFTVRMGETKVDFEVVQADPNRTVWLVRDSAIPFLRDAKEWNQTTVEFTVSESNGLSTVTLVHHGLGPQCECYEMCTQGWEHYFGKSLKAYLETTQGTPLPKDN